MTHNLHCFTSNVARIVELPFNKSCRFKIGFGGKTLGLWKRQHPKGTFGNLLPTIHGIMVFAYAPQMGILILAKELVRGFLALHLVKLGITKSFIAKIVIERNAVRNDVFNLYQIAPAQHIVHPESTSCIGTYQTTGTRLYLFGQKIFLNILTGRLQAKTGQTFTCFIVFLRIVAYGLAHLLALRTVVSQFTPHLNMDTGKLEIGIGFAVTLQQAVHQPAGFIHALLNNRVAKVFNRRNKVA